MFSAGKTLTTIARIRVFTNPITECIANTQKQVAVNRLFDKARGDTSPGILSARKALTAAARIRVFTNPITYISPTHKNKLQ
jgi:hypothetical protein